MNYNVKSVLGVSWGDEGKGKVINALSSNIINKGVEYVCNMFDTEIKILGYSIRSNGGPNGGHALVAENGVKVTGHVLPSTITKKGFVNIVGAGCVVDLAGLKKEIDEFKENNLFIGKLIIDPRVNIIIEAYRALDGFRGKFSTGSGIADVYGHAAKRDGLCMADVVESDKRKLDLKLSKLSKSLRAEFDGIVKERDNVKQDVILNFEKITDVDFLKEHISKYNKIFGELVNFKICTELPKDVLRGVPLLNETSQSYFLSLSQNNQNGTSSIVDPNWVFISQGIPIVPQEIHMITKLFPSRVGNGAFIGEFGDRDLAPNRCGTLEKYKLDFDSTENDFLEVVKQNPNDREVLGDVLRLVYNEFGETTGRARGKAPLDLTYLRTLYTNIAASPVNKSYLWINQVDVANEIFDKIPFIESYEFEDETIEEYLTIRANCDNEKMSANIVEFDSWKGDLVPNQSELPEELNEMINYIKYQTKLSVGGIGVGRKDLDLIYIDYKNN